MYCYVRDCTNSAKNLRERKKGSELTKYFSAPEDKSLLEKWKRVIPRGDKVFTSNDKVCDLHFLGSEVQWFTETKLPNGNVRRLLVDQPVLKPGTIPSIFPPEKLETAKTTVKTTPIPPKEKIEIPRPIIKTPNVTVKEKFSTSKSGLRTPVVFRKDKIETPKSSIRVRLREPPVTSEKRHTQRVKRRSTILDDYVTDDELSQVHGQGGTSKVISASVKKRKTENSEMLQPIIRLVPLECLMDQKISQSKVPVKPLGEKCTEEIDLELKKVIEIPLLTKLRPKKSVTFKTKDIVQFKTPNKAVPRTKMKLTSTVSDSHLKSPTEEDREETAILNEVKTEIPDIIEPDESCREDWMIENLLIEEELARMEMDDEDVKSSDIVAVNSLDDDSVVVKSEEEDIEDSYGINEETKDVSNFGEEDVVVKSEDESEEVPDRNEISEETSMNGEGAMEVDINIPVLNEERERSEVAVEAEQCKDVECHKGDESLAEDQSADSAKVAEDQSADSTKVAEDQSADSTKVAEDQSPDNTKAAEDQIVDGTKAAEVQSGDKVKVAEDILADEAKDAEDQCNKETGGDAVDRTNEGGNQEVRNVGESIGAVEEIIPAAESDETGQALSQDAEVTSLVESQGDEDRSQINEEKATGGKDHVDKIVNIDEASELETESHETLVAEESANKVPIEQKSDDISSDHTDAVTIELDEDSELLMGDKSDDTPEKDKNTEVSSKSDENDNPKASVGSISNDEVLEISDSETVAETEGSEETGIAVDISDKGEENPVGDDGQSVADDGSRDGSSVNRTPSNETGSVQDAQEDNDDDVHLDTDTHEEIEEMETINEDEVNIEAEDPKEDTAAQNVENEDDIDIEAEVARLVSEVGEGSEEYVKETADCSAIDFSEDEENKLSKKTRGRKASQGKEIVLRETPPIAGEITSTGVQNLFSPETIQEILKQIKLPLTTPVTLRIAPLLNTPTSSSPVKGKVTKTTRRRGGRGGNRTGNRRLSRAGSSKEQNSIEQFRQLTKTRTVFDFPTYISDIDDDIQYWKLCQIIKESFHELIEARNTKTSIGRLTLSITFNKPKRQEVESETEICYEGSEAVNR